MRLTLSTEFKQLETWLNILITAYKKHPSRGLAKTIDYYLSRLLHHDDINLEGGKHCDYLSMQKYWRWQAKCFYLKHS